MLRASVAALVLAAAAAPAQAYEFWLRAETLGQAYQLRDYKLIGPDLFLGRRRYTQSLALRIWDVGDLAAARREAHLPERGLRISWQSYLRIDHDYGEYTSGKVILPLSVPVRRDALDVTPELGESVASLDLLYGYVELAGLVDDRLTVQVGRLLSDDGWGTAGVDGATARLRVPETPLTVAATAGFAVRASSPLGVAAYELDGTAGAGCQEYVEGPTPGTGTWQLIDRNRAVTNHALASDYETCPQRDVRQPTAGVALQTAAIHGFAGEIGYRRTWSRTVGITGLAVQPVPDLGLYPDEYGQAPGSGVDEERVWARVHGALRAGDVTIAPYADARYSLLHAGIDRADAGVRLSRGAHSLEPAIEYFSPTFDGDSIFNAFSIEPTTDVRLAYERAGELAIRASGWLRAYRHEDGLASYAGGGDAGVARGFGSRWRARLDALWDDGYGGRRVGGSGEVGWRPVPTMWLRGRLIALAVAQDGGGDGSAARPRYVTSSAVTSWTWRLADGVALHTILELDRDAQHAAQYRAIGMFDFAFAPEP
jgi:hypothetical protein